MKKRNKIIIWLIIILVTLAAIAYFLNPYKKPKIVYDTFIVEKGILRQTVSSTGKIKSAADIDLNFKTTGKLAQLKVKVGDQVMTGDELANLDLRDLESSITEAEANLEVAQASYNKIKAGNRSEVIAVSQANLEKTKTAYLSAQKDYNNVIQTSTADIARYNNALTDAQTSLADIKNVRDQDIINTKDTAITKMETYKIIAKASLDVVNETLNDRAAHNTLSVKNTAYLKIAQENYSLVWHELNDLDSYLVAAKLTKNEKDIKAALEQTLTVLNSLSRLLDDTFNVLLATITSSDLSELALDALKTNIRTEQTNTNTAISAIQLAEQNLNGALLAYTTDVNTAQAAVTAAQDTLNQALTAKQSKIDTAEAVVDAAKRALEIAERQLLLDQAPARQEDLDLSLAQIKQSQAALEIANNQLVDSVLRAPVDGVITAVNYEVGEQTSLTKPLITMYSEGRFEIEVDISEADIAKVAVSNLAKIDFDAFGNEVIFDGRVTYIDPAETVIQEVVYYQVKITFDDKNYAILPGLTANAEILTAEKNDVLKILQRAVYEREGQKYVKVLSNGQEVEKMVGLGLKGDNGLVEIVAGLNEGEEVIVSVKNDKSKNGFGG